MKKLILALFMCVFTANAFAELAYNYSRDGIHYVRGKIAGKMISEEIVLSASKNEATQEIEWNIIIVDNGSYLDPDNAVMTSLQTKPSFRVLLKQESGDIVELIITDVRVSEGGNLTEKLLGGTSNIMTTFVKCPISKEDLIRSNITKVRIELETGYKTFEIKSATQKRIIEQYKEISKALETPVSIYDNF